MYKLYFCLQHIVAWHLHHRINVIVFAVIGKTIIIQQLIRDDGRDNGRRVCGILHKGNHYDYVKLPQNLDALRALDVWDRGTLQYP